MKDFAKYIVAFVMGPSVVMLLLYLFIVIKSHAMGAVTLGYAFGGIFTIIATGGFLLCLLMYIVYLTQYHAETIKGAILEASKNTKDEE